MTDAFPFRPPGEPDLCWVAPGFAIGSLPYAVQRRRIRDLGIKVVVGVHEPDEREAQAWTDLGVRFVSVPTRDWVGIPSETFERVVEVVSECLASGTPVLLHCLAGINRAPTFAAAVLCRQHGTAVEAALEAVRRVRPAASPTPEQRASLQAWLGVRSDPSSPGGE